MFFSLGRSFVFASLGRGLAFRSSSTRSLGSHCLKFALSSLFPVFPHLNVLAVDVLRKDLEPIISESFPSDSASFRDDFDSFLTLALVVVHFGEVSEELAQRLVLLVELVAVADNFFGLDESLLKITCLHKDQKLNLLQLTNKKLVLDAVSFQSSDSDSIFTVLVSLLSEQDRNDSQFGS